MHCDWFAMKRSVIDNGTRIMMVLDSAIMHHDEYQAMTYACSW